MTKNSGSIFRLKLFRCIAFISGLVLTISLTGCGTIATHSSYHENHATRNEANSPGGLIYAGTKHDLKKLSNTFHYSRYGYYLGSAMEEFPPFALLAVLPTTFSLIDTPLSFSADTLLLPCDISRYFNKTRILQNNWEPTSKQ